MIRKILYVVLVCLVVTEVTSAGEQWGIKDFFIYSKFSFSVNRDESFEIKNTRLCAEVERNNKFVVTGEFEAGEDSSLIVYKLSAGYKFYNWLRVTVGQFSNPIIFFDPTPDQKNFVYNPLSGYNPSKGDRGIGLSGKFLFNRHIGLKYNLCLFNGTGINRADDNRKKDLVTYFSLVRPDTSFVLNWCRQAGRQPDGYRVAEHFYISFSPFKLAGLDHHNLKSLKLEAVSIRRSDLEESGYYLSGFYNISQSSQLVARLHRLNQKEAIRLTLGANFFLLGGALKLQPNIIVSKGLKPEWVGQCQVMLKF